MRFPNRPHGMDQGFFDELQSYGRFLERRIDEIQTNNRPIAKPLTISTGSNQTLTIHDMGKWYVINASADFSITLPASAEGIWVGLYLYTNKTVTLKNPAGTSIGTLTQYDGTIVQTWPDSSGVYAWPTAISDLYTSFSLSAAPTDL